MTDWLMQPNFLHWWIGAAVLALVEVFLPRRWLLWLAGAAAVTGFVLLLRPGLGWPGQLLLFAVCAGSGLVFAVARRLRSGGNRL